MQLFAGRLRDDLDPAIERIVLVHAATRSARPPPNISANISRKLIRTCANVSAKSFCVVLLIRAMTSSSSRRDGGQIVVLRFEKTVALFELVVFVDGVEIDRAHVVELTSELGDDLRETGVVVLAWRSDFPGLLARGSVPTFLVASFQLRVQRFLEREMICLEITQIDLISPVDMFRQVFDLQLQLRLANLLFAAKIAQVIE